MKKKSLAVSGAVVTLTMLVLTLAYAGDAARNPATWIVYAASPEHGTQPTQLFRVRSDGTGLRQFTTGVHPASAPAFSPAGTKVVFARSGSGLFVVKVDGSGLHRLTAGADDTLPVWSRDGTRIAFLRPYRGEFHLYVMSANGRKQRLLRRAPAPAGRPSWTPDGNIVIPSGGKLHKVSAGTGRVLRRLNVVLEAETSLAIPSLAPNGRTIAYIGPRPAPPNCEGPGCEVYALYIKRLTGRQREVDDAGPAGWSADSRTLVFARAGRLILQGIDGSTRTTIGLGSSAIEGAAPPAWQPPLGR